MSVPDDAAYWEREAERNATWWRERAEPAEAQRDEAVALLRELTDPDECWYDHHGYCQAHSLGEKPCPHTRARAFLASFPQGGEE